jgi:hypothetical protein
LIHIDTGTEYYGLFFIVYCLFFIFLGIKLKLNKYQQLKVPTESNNQHHNMCEHNKEDYIQSRIRELENELKIAKSVLLHTTAVLIEERSIHTKTCEYVNTMEQENALLKERIKELTKERPAIYTPHERTTSPLSVSVSVSPRLHPQPHPHPHPHQPQTRYQCSPAMATCDGLYFSPSSSCGLMPNGSAV